MSEDRDRLRAVARLVKNAQEREWASGGYNFTVRVDDLHEALGMTPPELYRFVDEPEEQEDAGVTLTEFLTARLDETTARAEAMTHELDPEGEPGFYACPESRTEPYGDLPWGPGTCQCGLARRKEHMLREVESKRAIIGLLQPVSHGAILRHLAAVYADHPDYDEAWRP